jgi:signal peptidase I
VVVTAHQRKSLAHGAWEWTKSIAAALVIWSFLRALLVEAFRIPSGSMENTLQIGDFLFVNKALYGAEIPVVHTRLPAFREPKRGDVVVFDSETEQGVNVVKRIIGMPGDTISMEDNVVYIDGQPLAEPYALKTGSDQVSPEMRAWQVRYLVGRDPKTYQPSLWNWGPLLVPADSVFVMGDNRDSSYDSRYWGFLASGRIRGRPMFIYYSYDKNGLLPLPFFTAIRWNRIFTHPH